MKQLNTKLDTITVFLIGIKKFNCVIHFCQTHVIKMKKSNNFKNRTGLEYLNAISVSRSYQLRVDLEDWDGNTAYAIYRYFVLKKLLVVN